VELDLSQQLINHLKDMYEQLEIYNGQYSELNTRENGILRAVERLDNPRVSDISRELNISMSTASWCIDRLEKTSFLKRHRSDEDRRVVFLSLTRKGQRIVRQFDGMFEKIAAVAEDNLSKRELESFLEMLKRIHIMRD